MTERTWSVMSKRSLLSEHGTLVGPRWYISDIPDRLSTIAIDNRGMKVGDLTVHVIVHGIWDPDVMHASMETIERVMPQPIVSNTKSLQDYYEKEKGDSPPQVRNDHGTTVWMVIIWR